MTITRFPWFIRYIILIFILFYGLGFIQNSYAKQESTLHKVINRGTLRVGDCLSFAPFGYYNTKHQPTGYDVDIAKQMAKDLGVKLKMVDVTSNNRIPSLKTGKVDVVICNFTRTPERAKSINFTNPYVVAGESLLIRKGSDISGLKDLSGKNIATVKGSTNSQIVKEKNPEVNVHEYNTSSAAVLAVRQHKVAAMVEDSNFLNYQAKIHPNLRVIHKSIVPLEYNGFGIKQGDLDWLTWLNLFIRHLNLSGKNTALYKHWFGTKPPYKLNPSY